MFYDDSPLSTLLNVGMWGFSFFCGHQSGKNAALKQISDQQRDAELQQLRQQVAELSRKLTPPPKP